MKELRGKQANIIRWESLKRLDWIKDKEMIDYIMDVQNPLFFSKRTVDEVLTKCKEDIAFDKKFREVFGC